MLCVRILWFCGIYSGLLCESSVLEFYYLGNVYRRLGWNCDYFGEFVGGGYDFFGYISILYHVYEDVGKGRDSIIY